MQNSQQIQPVPVLDLGFLGAGRMATALAVGWKHAGLLKLGHCQASDPFAAACESFHQATGYWATDDNRAMLKASKVVVLAVKPQQLHAVIADFKGDLGAEKLIISIVAGATLPTLGAALGHQRVIRVMPNTPCQVGASASAFSCGKQASTEDSQVVSRLFGSVGIVFELKESGGGGQADEARVDHVGTAVVVVVVCLHYVRASCVVDKLTKPPVVVRCCCVARCVHANTK